MASKAELLPPFEERLGCEPERVLALRRGAIAAAVASGRFSTNPPAIERTLGGVRTLCFAPPERPRGTVLHFHGGGLRIGCPEIVAPYAAALAARAAVVVVCPAYRLAPEHPFPAGLNDAWGVACALGKGEAGKLIVAGDSAGGGIAASLTALLVETGNAPDGLVLISPWLDLTVTAATYDNNAATDPDFSRAAARAGADAYLAGVAADEPLVSPIFASVASFPPTFISVGAGEVLSDDSENFAQALAAVGVEAHLSVRLGMSHVAVTRDFALSGATETFADVAAYIDRIIG